MKAYQIAIAVALVAGLATATASAQEPAPEARQIQVTILGMSCPFCAYGVQQKLSRVEGVTDLKVELSTGLATLTLEEDADIPNDLLLETVDEAGFEVAKIVRNFDSEFPDWTAPSGAELGAGVLE